MTDCILNRIGDTINLLGSLFSPVPNDLTVLLSFFKSLHEQSNPSENLNPGHKIQLGQSSCGDLTWYDKKCCSEMSLRNHTLFPLFGEGLGTRHDSQWKPGLRLDVWWVLHNCEMCVCRVSCPTLSWGKGSGNYRVLSWLCWVSSLDSASQ